MLPHDDISTLHERLTRLKQPPFDILLVDDQELIATAIRNMLKDDPAFTLHHCTK